MDGYERPQDMKKRSRLRRRGCREKQCKNGTDPLSGLECRTFDAKRSGSGTEMRHVVSKLVMSSIQQPNSIIACQGTVQPAVSNDPTYDLHRYHDCARHRLESSLYLYFATVRAPFCWKEENAADWRTRRDEQGCASTCSPRRLRKE